MAKIEIHEIILAIIIAILMIWLLPDVMGFSEYYQWENIIKRGMGH